MKLIISLIFAGFYATQGVAAYDLKAGDVILQPLMCWSCSLIAAQEESNFSHIGIVIKKNKKLMVAEAFGKVRLISLSEFTQKTHPEKKIKILRLKNKSIKADELLQELKSYLGNPYDNKFRWNNYIGDLEAIYCSELVYKILNPLVKFNDLAPKRMTFDVNPNLWDQFFRGDTPRGELGISPEDFNKSVDFFEVQIKGF